tara:strand:+ start:5738 stop:6706 length:969 start_codon:yes stop_codon:yes gene_type:complete
MKNIAVVFGGFSSEFEVSVKSGKYIYENLKDNQSLNVYQICISKESNYVIYDNNNYDLNYMDFSFSINGKVINLDGIFNIIHGEPGENGDLADVLEKNNIPQTGCNSFVSNLTFDKKRYIDFVNELDVPSSKHILLTNKNQHNLKKIINKINIPCIVKPNNGGSSIGVSKVYHIDDLKDKIKIAFKESDQVLIEDFLYGQEVSVGVLETNGERIILPVTEIISENELFDYGAKYLGQSKEITPGNISDKEKSLIHEYINKIYDNIELKGFTRSEFIIVDGIPHILETNTIPGFTKQSIIPQQLEAFGLSVKEVINNQIKSIL